MEQRKFSTRIVMGNRFALIPPDEIHTSRLPIFGDAKLKVLASPHIGASFVEYLVELRKNQGTPEPLGDEKMEYFVYGLEGKTSVNLTQSYDLTLGDYLFIPPGTQFSIRNKNEQLSKFLLFKVRHTPFGSKRPNLFFGNEAKAPEEPEVLNPMVTWKILLPKDAAYDMAFNIAVVPSGIGFDASEIHFEEHGLYVLTGQGLYLIGTTWFPYREGDFIYLGPFVPQSVYATGTTETRYLASKNINRDPPL